MIRVKNIGIGVLTGYVITAFFLLILALLLTFTNMGESLLAPLVTLVNLLGIFFAGFWSVRRITSGGWLIGGIAGVISPLILRLIGAVAYGNGYWNSHLLWAVLLGFFVGALGGIAGINLGYRARKKSGRKT